MIGRKKGVECRTAPPHNPAAGVLYIARTCSDESRNELLASTQYLYDAFGRGSAMQKAGDTPPSSNTRENALCLMPETTRRSLRVTRRRRALTCPNSTSWLGGDLKR